MAKRRDNGLPAPWYTGGLMPQSSEVYSAFVVARWTGTLPATVVIAITRALFERSAMINATASSDAVSVSISIAAGTPQNTKAAIARPAPRSSMMRGLSF